jgi:hypothetical protein
MFALSAFGWSDPARCARSRLALHRRTLARRALPLLAALLLACAAGLAAPARADEPQGANDSARILQSFEQVEKQQTTDDASDHTRRWVMFGLGAPLLILILLTGGLGIAMGVYGKQVFVAHMICAGLSITLAIVHAIVGLVWFRPF